MAWFIDQGPGRAPAVSPRPEGLPRALTVPEEARCLDAMDGSVLVGTFRPAALDLYIARRDLALDLYPVAAQRKLDEEAAAWAKRKDNAVADARAQAVVNSVDREVAEVERANVPLWAAAAVALAGIAVGAGVVAVVGW